MASALAEEKFEKFDWNNADWHKYFDNLYPTPAQKLVDKFKRRWFKANIDGNLELKSSEQTEPSQTASVSSQGTRAVTNVSRLRQLSLGLLILAMLYSIIYVLPLGYQQARIHAIILYIVGYILILMGTYGKPQWNQAYWQRLLMDEVAQSLSITCSALMMMTWVALVSPFLTSLIFISDHAGHLLPLVPTVFQMDEKVREGLHKVKCNRYYVMQTRANFEVFLGFLSLLLIMRSMRVTTVFFYWNMIRFKYQTDPFTQATFRMIDGHILYVIQHPFCPGLILTGYSSVKNVLGKFVNPL